MYSVGRDYKIIYDSTCNAWCFQRPLSHYTLKLHVSQLCNLCFKEERICASAPFSEQPMLAFSFPFDHIWRNNGGCVTTRKQLAVAAGVVPAMEEKCKDSLLDPLDYECYLWKGFDCSVVAGRDNYTEDQIKQLLISCPHSCNMCSLQK